MSNTDETSSEQLEASQKEQKVQTEEKEKGQEEQKGWEELTKWRHQKKQLELLNLAVQLEEDQYTEYTEKVYKGKTGS